MEEQQAAPTYPNLEEQQAAPMDPAIAPAHPQTDPNPYPNNVANQEVIAHQPATVPHTQTG